MSVLLILPGLDGRGLMHEAFIAALGPHVTVTAVRYPDTEVLGYGELERIVCAAVPARGDFFVLGESFSGPLAVRLAAAYPARVRGVILCGSFLRNPRPGLAWLRPALRGFPLLRGLLSAVTPVLLGKAASPALRRMLAEALAHAAPAVLAARLCAAMAVDVTAPFAALECPILYLRATHDRIVPRHAAEQVVQANPRVRLVELAASHFILQTAPLEAARAVAAFMSESPRQ